jgi:hypothetical protein
MDVIKTLSAGAPGTKRYQRRYGANLVCVRYRTDEAGRQRLTTVEIVVDQTALLPPRAKASKASSLNDNQRLLVRVGFEEDDLRQRIKQAGGWWLPKQKLWRVPQATVQALKLESRVVGPAD